MTKKQSKNILMLIFLEKKKKKKKSINNVEGKGKSCQIVTKILSSNFLCINSFLISC